MKKNWLAWFTGMLCFTSCQKRIQPAEMVTSIKMTNAKPETENTAGFVFTLSNQVPGNQVLVYSRSSSGHLVPSGAYSTGGTGTGTGLGNQGAVVLSGDNEWLLAVNPGSNTISSFAVTGEGLVLKSTVPSGGIMPVSIDIYNNLVYVLNDGGTANISGFMLGANGELHAIAGSTKPLTTPAPDAAQVSFVNNGTSVVITEKATNKIVSYTINTNGTPGMMHSLTSANPTPFGFAVRAGGIIYVSEAAGGAPGASSVSSYFVNSSGAISLADGPVLAGQTAACWVVLTNNGKYVYATNTGSNTISSFSSATSGSLDILQEAAAISTTAPIDAALSNNSKFLYVLNAGTDVIAAYGIANSGNIELLQTIPGIPNEATGLAAK